MSEGRHDLWTRDQEQRLLEICEHTHRAADIARALEPVRSGVTKNAIIGKVERMRRLGHQIAIGPPGGGYPDQNKPRKVRKVYQPAIWETSPVSTLPQRKHLPPSEPATEPEIFTMRCISLMELGPRTCRWPLGDEPPFLFCGNDTGHRERRYCPVHHVAAYHR